MKVALCCIVKNENKYLIEYIEHYKKLGICHFYVYDNNDVDGEHPEEVLQEYIDNGLITVINYRGFKVPQLLAYQNCYNTYNTEYDWMCFFDADEFLKIRTNKYNNLNDVLAQSKFNNYQVITIHWECYGDSDKLYYYDAPIQERFTQKANYDWMNILVKSIVKCNIGIVIVWDSRIPYSNPHVPTGAGKDGQLMQLAFCNSNGHNSYYYPINNDDEYTDLILNHYITKSTEEWVQKKLRLLPDRSDGLNDLNWEKLIDEYFKLNTFSIEKFRLIQKLVNEKYGENKV